MVVRLLDLGVLVDCLDRDRALLTARLVGAAGLDRLWIPDRAPRGPCPSGLVGEVAAAATVPVSSQHDHTVVRSAPDRDLSAAVEEAVGGVLEVPVSIGRTRQEARARVLTTTAFDVVGHPGKQGLFGTLEDCQELTQAWARAGVRGLCLVLPDLDLPDVLAQLHAVALGDPLAPPSTVRSPAPAPPAGWGGPAVP